ncbi:hypothetical protein QJS10_CPA06g00567 [Acorus calamus]|uniref:Uncharacterized protein n=1 Tax=Acorus calamus TaxID=4465 RepID=A0AAV9EIM6_ACOCL|nr:hypothetical protein QJS10_CPA06g00567 [Acorus calamus]
MAFSTLEELWDRMITPISGYPGATKKITHMFVPAALWALWLARNGVLFSGHRFYMENVWEDTLGFIKAWSGALAGVHGFSCHRGRFYIS